jgi:hypothetical protein
MTDKRVPREPTPEMIEAAMVGAMTALTAIDKIRAGLIAAYDAAPAAPDERDEPSVIGGGAAISFPITICKHGRDLTVTGCRLCDDKVRSERDALKAALRECSITLAHARTFIVSRERMHPDGVALFDAAMEATRALLAAPDAP